MKEFAVEGVGKGVVRSQAAGGDDALAGAHLPRPIQIGQATEVIGGQKGDQSQTDDVGETHVS